MDLNEYQKRAEKTAVYPMKWHKVYPLLALAGEVGELLNLYKKVMRGDEGAEEQFKKNLEGELGDILWYVAAIATDFRIHLNDVANFNLKKLDLRKKTGRLKGQGSER